ncbi:MAG: hypothetical protein V1779_02445 [bacterium]
MKYLVSTLLFLLLFSCENNNEPVQSTIIEGESTVKTDSLSFFSFKTGKALGYPIDENISDVFSTMVFIHESGEPIGIGFVTAMDYVTFSVLFPGNESHIDNLDTALKIFDTLSIIDKNLSYSSAIVVYQSQVIAVKTKENKYALMVITDSKYYRDTTIADYESYKGYVTFKWKYQTNGSRNFNY